MIFTNTEHSLIERDILNAEKELGFPLPPSVREHYLRWNGGQPEPDFFGEPGYSRVHEVIPLVTKDGKGSVVVSYQRLVADECLMPPQWVPFAVDPGGDYFFVNCSTSEPKVILFRGEYWDEPDRCILDLNVTFPEFWQKLVEEPE